MTGYSDDELTERYDDDESFDRARAIRISQLLQEVAEVRAREQSLLAEVERLRAENAAMREIVQTVADLEPAMRDGDSFPSDPGYHVDSLIRKARALLAAQ